MQCVRILILDNASVEDIRLCLGCEETKDLLKSPCRKSPTLKDPVFLEVGDPAFSSDTGCLVVAGRLDPTNF